MGGRTRSKLILWLVLALPAAAILHRYATDPGLWPGDLLRPTGEWSARLLIFALCLTPLCQLLPRSRAIQWLVAHRRAFGVGAFAYALLHLLFYLLDMGALDALLAELAAPGIWTAWVALLCLVPPALASNDAAVRRLGAAWKKVQRLAYPAALFTLAHWALVHDSLAGALIHFAPLAALQSARLFRTFTTSTQRSLT